MARKNRSIRLVTRQELVGLQCDKPIIILMIVLLCSIHCTLNYNERIIKANINGVHFDDYLKMMS